MKKKERISDFIESIKDGEVESTSVILGGASNDGISPQSIVNHGDCTNVTYEGCKKATNNGGCRNAIHFCNDSKNGGNCDNSYQPYPKNVQDCSQAGR